MGAISDAYDYMKKFFEGGAKRKSQLRLALSGFCFFGVLLALFIVNLTPERVELEVGHVARRDIMAPRSIVDRPRTDKAREEAGRAAVEQALKSPDFYQVSQAASIKAREVIETIFQQVEETYIQIHGEPREAEDEAEIVQVRDSRVLLPLGSENLRKRLHDEHGLEFSTKTIAGLLSFPLQEIEDAKGMILDIVFPIMEKERIDETNLASIKDKVDVSIDSLEIADELRTFVRQVGRNAIWPNLVLNTEKVERERQRAMKEVPSTMILNGQKIIGNGEVVTADDIIRLQDLGLIRAGIGISQIIGVVLMVLGLMVLVTIYMYRFSREVLQNERLVTLLGCIIVGVTALAVIFPVLFPWEWYPYAVPVAFGTMMVTVLLSPRLAVVTSVVLGISVGMIFDGRIDMAVVSMVGGLVGTYSVAKVNQRSDLVRAGLIVGAANMVSVLSLGLVKADPLLTLLLNSLVGMANGIVSSILTIGFLPFAEHIFGLTSSIKLLELSNPNHPLLKKLMLGAPGTYHHSIIVGNLAEAAAESIGANPLIARVGAHYHDVGKTKRPYHFIENQFMGENPHDKFSPSLSTLIITSHVRDGVDMAREYGLPEPIVNIIREHHGTTLVSYFYRKALENGPEDSIIEEDFRYDGPRPQSKEAAIIMLADAVEAAVRSLTKPEPGQIEAVVGKIIKDRLNDGQFDECDVTLRDLDKIGKSFIGILSGIFHSRIEYPDKLIQKEESKRSKRQRSRATTDKSL